MGLKQQRKDNIYIQNNMYEVKSSKSVYKGLKSCLFLLVCMLFFGWMFYQSILEYKAGLKTTSILYWLYTTIGTTVLTIVYGLLCVLILFAGIWDVKRLKSIKSEQNDNKN